MTARRHGDRLDARDVRVLERTLDRLGPTLDRAYDPRVTGAEHLASRGPALLVGNHSGGPLALFEPLVLAHALRRELGIERMPRLLLHEIMWHTPLAPRLAALGAVRASVENATSLLDAGERVLVYPGGDREAFRSFLDRDRVMLGPRRGYVRLAIMQGVPLVPIVTAGMHSSLFVLHDGHAMARRLPLAKAMRVGVLPITLSVPFGLGVGVPPPYLPLGGRVRIRVLPPIRLSRHGADAAADEAYVEACHQSVTRVMQRALDTLADGRRAERRSALHARLDMALDALERWTTRRRGPRLRLQPAPAAPARRAA